MPKCVFKLLWHTLAGGDEIFGRALDAKQPSPGREAWELLS
jgi:hypothetical protein